MKYLIFTIFLVSTISAQYSTNLTNYAIIAASTITSVGTNTYIVGDVILSPGTSTSGLTQGWNVIGTIHINNQQAVQAKKDLNTSFELLSNLTADSVLVESDLSTLTLSPGVYSFSSAAISLNGNLTLNGTGSFVFRIDTAFITSQNCNIRLINGATASQIFFLAGSSITIGKGCQINGMMFAGQSISVDGAVVNGGLFARYAAVTLTQSSTIIANTLQVYTGPTVATAPGFTFSTTTVLHSSGNRYDNNIHFVYLTLLVIVGRILF